MSTQLPPRPIDATLTVTKAARLLGVHPNTVRAWSDAGRLRFYRINPRGDRRYRLGDLQRFLAVAERGATAPPTASTASIGRRSTDPGRTDPRLELVHLESDDTARHRRDLALLDAIAREPFGQTTVQEDLDRVAAQLRATSGRSLGRDREWQRSRHDYRLARGSRGDGDGHPRTRRCVGRAARRRGSRRAV